MTSNEEEAPPIQFALELEGKSSVIHTIECVEFIEKTGNGADRHDWYYPFQTYQEAFTYGANLPDRSYPKNCGKCKPEQHGEKKIEITTSFIVRFAGIERIYNITKAWLTGQGAQFIESTKPTIIKAKIGSDSTSMIGIFRELLEVQLTQTTKDVKIQLRLWIDTKIDYPETIAYTRLNLRTNQTKKELTQFIKDSTQDSTRDIEHTYRDAFNNLRYSRPLLAKVTDDVDVEGGKHVSYTTLALILSVILLITYGGFFYSFDLNPFTENIIELVVTYGAAAFLIYWTYLSDKTEAEPLAYILLMFCWGIFAGLIAAQFNSALGNIIPVPPYFIAPFIEEPIKALGLYVFLTHPRTRDEFNSPLDGIIYGFTVGIGFYASENFVYYLNYDVKTLLVRILFCWGHGLYCAIVGLWIAVNRHYRGYNVPRDMIPGLSVAVFMHFLWNTGFWVYYQALFQFNYLKKIINEAKRDEEYSGKDRAVFSSIIHESADSKSGTSKIFCLILVLSVGCLFVYGSEWAKGDSLDWVVYDNDLGFSFLYPERLWFETYGEKEGEAASESFGEIWFSNYRGHKRELLRVVYGSYGMALNAGYDSDLVGEDFVLGHEVEFISNGHRAWYRRGNMTFKGEAFSFVTCSWSCRYHWRIFVVQYYCTDGEYFQTWKKIIDSFQCHELE